MKNKDLIINCLLVLVSILIGFILLESISRPRHLPFKNLILEEGGDLVDHLFKRLFKHDPDLGWVPMSNVSLEKWGGKVTTLDDGIRSNGRDLPLDPSHSILAIGDSFTFGDGVSDENTWPAFLEVMLRRKVYNAGVSSYGLDQVILRAEPLIKKYDPKTIVFSMIYDDMLRTTQKIRHGVPKPYFTIQGDQFVLNRQGALYGFRFDLFRHIFGYSYVAHKIMSGAFPHYWFSGTTRDMQTVPGDTMDVSLRIFDRFMGMAQSREVVLLVQGSTDTNRYQLSYLGQFIASIKNKHPNVKVVFFVPALLQLKENNFKAFDELFVNDPAGRHPTPQTNMLIAQLVAKELNAGY